MLFWSETGQNSRVLICRTKDKVPFRVILRVIDVAVVFQLPDPR